jgi:hypothetical protein
VRLGRLADTMFAHGRKVIWLAAPVLAAGGDRLNDEFTADYNTPGTGCADAADRLEHRFGAPP